jgi:hypothetical protein
MEGSISRHLTLVVEYKATIQEKHCVKFITLCWCYPPVYLPIYLPTYLPGYITEVVLVS